MKKTTLLLGFVALLLISLVPQATANVPVVDVVLLSQDPQPARPGSFIDVVLKVENKALIQARNFEAEFVNAFPFSVVDGNTKRFVGTVPFLSDREPIIIRYRLLISDGAPAGKNKFTLRYTFDGTSQPIEREFEIDVRSLDASLFIQNVQTQPEQLVAGQDGRITLRIANGQGGTLRDIDVKMGFDALDVPLVPIGSASRQKISFLANSESQEIAYNINVNSRAEPGTYRIPVEISFSDNLGNKFTQNDIIGVRITGTPQIVALLDETTLFQGENQGDVTVRLVNKGFTDIKFLTITPQNTDEYQIVGRTSSYLGNLDSDDFDSSTFTLRFASGVPETFTLPLAIQYRDTNDQTYITTENIVVNTLPPRSNGSGTIVIIAIIIIALIVGGYWLYKRKRSRDE